MHRAKYPLLDTNPNPEVLVLDTNLLKNMEIRDYLKIIILVQGVTIFADLFALLYSGPSWHTVHGILFIHTVALTASVVGCLISPLVERFMND